MRNKTFLGTLILAASLPLATPSYAGDETCPQITTAAIQPLAPTKPSQEAGDTLAVSALPDVGGDIVGGRGPNPHARELKQIAIYNAIGNRDGAERLSAQLREQGVARDTIQHAADRIKVHETSRNRAPQPEPEGMGAGG